MTVYLTRFYACLTEFYQEPVQPLYGLGEVVYVAISGQQTPSGPYTVVSVTANCYYTLKSQDNHQLYPYAVPENSLRVLA